LCFPEISRASYLARPQSFLENKLCCSIFTDPLGPLASHRELAVLDPMEKDTNIARPIDAPGLNSVEQVVPHKAGISMVVNESKEVGSTEPVSSDQMDHSQLRKNAKTITNRGSDPRKEIVAATEQLVSSSIQGNIDVKILDGSAI
jgi:hypothetical protein